METQFIKLNMTPTGINPCFHVSQYDIGRSLGFMIYNGSEVVDLDSYTCTIEATRSDGVAITASVATDDNIGTFETTATMTNKADKYRAQFVIVDGDSNRIASLPFDMEVIKAAMDENAESIEEDASLYQQYTEAVQGAIAEANADIQAEENARIAAVNAEVTARANADATLQNNIDAEATARQTADNTLQGNINSEASARTAADNTLQGNINSEASARASADSNLQSQINQIIAPSGEAPSAAEVQNARIGADGNTYSTLGDAIRANDNILKNTLSLVTHNEPILYTKGKYISTNGSIGTTVNTSLQTEPTFECAIVPCSEGDVFTVAGHGGSYPQLWCFTDASYKITRNSGFNVTESEKVLTAQSGEAYLILNNNDFTKQTVKGIKLQNRVSDIEAKYFRPLEIPSGTTTISSLRRCGAYSITNTVWQNLTDKPTNSPVNSVSTLINITNALNNNHIIQFLLCGTGETYRRYINTSGEVYQNWSEIDILELKNNIQYTFMSRHPAGNETTLASMRNPGVYNLDVTLVQNITDLPDGLSITTLTLINYINAFASSNIIQKLITLDMIEYTRILNSNGTVYKGWKKTNGTSDVLYNKKLVTAGDSYTAANYGSDSPYTLKNYGYYIAQRHSMEFVNAGISGSIMALDKTYVADPTHVDINYHNPFSYQRYLNIPSDTDYLIIWFGINDATNTNLGTIDDITNETFYGAWNKVLKHYLTNYPFMKVGIIITVGATEEYRQAVRNVAQKWGYPYLDLVNDVQIPAFFDRNGMSAEAQGLRKTAFGYDDYNGHPSPEWHIYASTFFENFLKTL